MSTKSLSLVEDFWHFFEVSVARSPEQLAEVFGIRYRVYCEEFGYEPRERFPDRQERDAFDDQSLHCIIVHRTSRLPAGCVRLVFCDEGHTLPMETFCREALDPRCLADLRAERPNACEVSRLAVDRRFRRRAGEGETRFGHVESLDFSAREVRTFSLIAVAAYLSATALTTITGRTFVHAMMEPFLPRLLRRSGIRFQAAGTEMDYHGLRAPYVTRSEEVVAGMQPELRELYNTIHSEFSRQLGGTESPGRAGKPSRRSRAPLWRPVPAIVWAFRGWAGEVRGV